MTTQNTIPTDAVLQSLARDRTRLLQALAPALQRVGSSNPNRSKVNARLATTRKRIRKELHANAEAMATRLMELLDE
jgi:hypothetical protein